MQIRTWFKSTYYIDGICLQIAMLIFVLVIQTSCGSNTFASPNTTTSITSPSHATIVSFATSNNTIYLADSDGNLVARRATDGQQLWSNQLPLITVHAYLASATNTLYDAYDSGTAAVVEARQPNNGHLLWSQYLPHLGPQPFIVRDDALYVDTYLPNHSGTIYALSPSNGQILWHFTSGKGATPDSFLFAAHGIAAINDSNGTIHVLHSQNGSQMFTYSCDTNWWPIADSNNIYIHCQYHPMQAYRISGGALLWTSKDSDWSFDIWIAAQGNVYTETRDGTLKAFNGQNGSLLWQTAPLGGNAYGEPVIQNQRIYVLGQNGGAAYHINNGSKAFSWQHSMESVRYYPEFANTDGIIFFGPDNHSNSIIAWNSNNGSDLWHYSSHATILWYPHTANGIMYIYKNDGTMDVVRMSDGYVLWRYSI